MSSVRIAVHVTPKSSRDEVAGWRGSELSVRVTAAPEGGRANAAACALLARELGVPKSFARVVRGEASRHKHIEVSGVDATAVADAFGRPDDSLF